MATHAYPFISSALNYTPLLSKSPPMLSLSPSLLTSSKASKINTFRSGRLRVSHTQLSTLELVVKRKVVSCCVSDDLELSPDNSSHSVLWSKIKEPLSADIVCYQGAATIDLKLPRRSLLVQFTCNECGERSQRLINRLAYEKGTVFVQCAGCLQHHKLVDNLGLIVEYDLREEAAVSEDQVPPVSSC